MDLVQQLKLIASRNWVGMGHAWMERVASDGAHEIERLRAENAKFTDMHQRTCPHMARTHNTGGWHCPECGKRGPILQPEL